MTEKTTVYGGAAPEYHYPLAEEIANAVTHGLGAILSVAALTAMVMYAADGGDLWRIASVSVFGATLIACYLASFLYHAMPRKWKPAMRTLDHCAIFLLIAGTYTPFLLVTMRGPIGWILFGLVWGIAVAGMIFKIVFTTRFPYLSTAIYVGMAWVALLAIKPVVTMMPSGALALMIAGGIIYMVGVAFYHWERLPYNHAIWHLFVLGGSAAHFLAVFNFVVPIK